MLAGHFAAAFGAKRLQPAVSLGMLVMASMLPDLLWSIFMIAGIEHVQFRPAMGAANYFAASNMALSHGLLMDGVWGILLSAGYYLFCRNAGGGRILFGLVLSHWVLDWISHRPDMPLAPGVHRYYGLGLWSSLPASLALEGGCWLLAVVFYACAARPRNRTGVFAFWFGVLILTLAWYNNLAGPPPRDPATAPIAGFIFFSLAVAWAWWIDRLRPWAAAQNPSEGQPFHI